MFLLIILSLFKSILHFHKRVLFTENPGIEFLRRFLFAALKCVVFNKNLIHKIFPKYFSNIPQDFPKYFRS